MNIFKIELNKILFFVDPETNQIKVVPHCVDVLKRIINELNKEPLHFTMYLNLFILTKKQQQKELMFLFKENNIPLIENIITHEVSTIKDANNDTSSNGIDFVFESINNNSIVLSPIGAKKFIHDNGLYLDWKKIEEELFVNKIDILNKHQWINNF